MLYALYGNDTYRSRKKMNQIIAAYREKAGAHIDLHHFDARTDDIGELKAMMGAQSLFTSKKLVVVENALGDEMAAVVERARQWKDAKDQHLLLIHETLDATAKKYLKTWNPALTQSQEFEELKGAKREAWIRIEASERGVPLTPGELRRIADATPDSWAAVQEIEKIAVGGESVTTALGAMPTIFDLGDAFFTDKKRTIGILHRFLESGEDEFGVFAYLANHSRKVLAIKQCAEKGKQIPSWLGIHPFVAKKTAVLVRSLALEQCAGFVNLFFEEDWRIKVGLSHPKDALVNMLTGEEV